VADVGHSSVGDRWVLDVGLSVALAVAIAVAPDQGAPPDAFAYGPGLTLAALALLRQRWPLPVLADLAMLAAVIADRFPGVTVLFADLVDWR
jgi:hypothetical protein